MDHQLELYRMLIDNYKVNMETLRMHLDDRKMIYDQLKRQHDNCLIDLSIAKSNLVLSEKNGEDLEYTKEQLERCLKYFETTMEKLGEHKDSLTDGTYLELCNQTKRP